MAKLEGNKLVLSKDETELLRGTSEMEIIPNKKGIFLLMDQKMVCEIAPIKKAEEILDEESQQVIGLIEKEKLSNLVEGKFEEQLNEKQKKALIQLLRDGKVFVFKLNESYKKGVYRVKEEETSKREGKKESEDFFAKEKPSEEYTIEEDGFLIIQGKENAYNASQHFLMQIKEGTLRGIKSFDGNYYLIQTTLLTDYMTRVALALSAKNNQSAEELAQNIKASKQLTKIICEFLKEEGQLLEKKKGLYQYIN
jgi:hypothetical protein